MPKLTVRFAHSTLWNVPMNSMRQRTKNDCAYTCIVILLRENWTLLKTQHPHLQTFRRYLHVKRRRIPITAKNKNQKVYVPHPYDRHLGMHDYQIEKTLLCNLKMTDIRKNICMRDLHKNKVYILALPSINFHNAGHCVIYRNGRIFDPSNLRRYVFRPQTKIYTAIEVSDLQDDDFDMDDQMTRWAIEHYFSGKVDVEIRER